MTKSLVESQARPSASTESLLRLRLHHLFVFTAVMAVLLAIQGPHQREANPTFAPLHVIPAAWGIWGVVYNLFVAGAITALAYGVVGYRREAPFFDQPGHWLLVEIAISTLLTIPQSLLYRTVDFPAVRPGSWAMTLMVLVSIFWLLSLILGRAVVNIFFARKCSERHWKRVFYVKAFAAVFYVYADFFVMVFTSVAERKDRREQVKRDASHFCGVVSQLAISGLTILSVLAHLMVR
jgi:hypothetical protein